MVHELATYGSNVERVCEFLEAFDFKLLKQNQILNNIVYKNFKDEQKLINFNTILNKIECKPTSIENEIFPNMVSNNELHSFDLNGFWMDVGQPKDFLTGTCLYLNYLKNKKLIHNLI